ncbi:Sodium/hydrogen exchanger family protein [Paenibacillus sp. UNC496MF]|nr:Sodium/hydrogen exchanger family protein [Paenibacillus sp. UNC496MF]
MNFGLVIGKMFIFFAIAGLMIWKGTPWLLKWLAPLRVTESVISAGLIICFLLAMAAEELGVAGIIGAFAAGFAVSRTSYKEEVEHKMEPIAYAVFVPIFFVSIGLSISFEGIKEYWGLIVILSAVAILTKLIGSGLGARLTGFSSRSSIGVGAGMVSRGEVSLIIATIGLENGLLHRDYFSVMVIVVIFTTLVTPILLRLIFRERSKKRAMTLDDVNSNR